MVEKCANCSYIKELKEDANKGLHCVGCNDDNNSKNWVYDTTLDEE